MSNNEEQIQGQPKIKPIVITDKLGILDEEGKQYELDFSRESAVYATDRGIDIGEENTSQRMKMVPTLFFCAFRKNHKMVQKEKIDRLLEANGGLSLQFISRLYDLLAQALSSNVVKMEDNEKNAAMDVEM